jgi:hypothetical protein
MPRALWLTLLCLLACALSWSYVGYYLRGGPRIIDATSYLLEAKSLAAGWFTFRVPDPVASFNSRFLLSGGDRHALGVIFPPGYPLLLSLGVRAGVPLLVGPVLGGLLVAVTYALARALGQDSKVALVAAVLSALCAALRYHTADTMSHGLATLLGCGALTCALRRDFRPGALLAGACLGLLLATRPVSALVSVLLVGFALRRAGARAWLSVAVGMLPGVALLLLQQHSLTGSFFDSTQVAYYTASDGPPGCFRYGFGAGIGCRFEHGDYVARFLPNGYGAAHALRNLGVHLWLFCQDATNTVPLTLMALYALHRHRATGLTLLGAGVALQALAYIPFYFDGNYPGGGARFLCEAIPLCQVLVARALVDLRLERFAAPLVLAGFALHARHGHEALRDREGGRPMFEPELLARAGVTRGLVFVDTDHGFNLGYWPGRHDPSTAVVVARRRGDANDRQLFERLGRPPTFHYHYDRTGRVAPSVTPLVPEPSSRLEAEAEWPAQLAAGTAYPIHYPCASAGRALRLYPGTRLLLPSPSSQEIELGWVSTGEGRAELELGFSGGPKQRFSALRPGCHQARAVLTLPSDNLSLPRPPPALRVLLVQGEGGLDYISKPRPEAVTR